MATSTRPASAAALLPELCEERVEDPRPRAPLLAVCGLAGGAGTSTLAYASASWCARTSLRPVLLADTGGPSASLAALADRSAPLSLPAASEALALGRLDRRPFASISDRLRLLARPPELGDAYDEDGLATLLAQAREAHALVVCDCGTLQRPIEWDVAARAQRIAWVTHASEASARVASDALAAHCSLVPEKEVLVARAGAADRAVRRALMAAAQARGMPLVLLADAPEVAANPGAALTRLAPELEAIAEALR